MERLKKAARADGPPTLSKSCSDKLALKQCTSLLSSPVSLLIFPENAYLDTLILPDHQYRQKACERSFGTQGRMKPVARRKWQAGYNFRAFQIETTSIKFPFSRRKANERSDVRRGSNISAVWTPRHQETLINGVLQGRKQTDSLGASMLSRYRMRRLLLETAALLEIPALESLLLIGPDSNWKDSQLLEVRQQIKQEARTVSLRGWCQVNNVPRID